MRYKQTCYCCGHPLLRHVRTQGVYWFCLHCYQEMPIQPDCDRLEQADNLLTVKKSDPQRTTEKSEIIA